MKTNSSGRAVFQRRTLVDQIADTLRAEIRSGKLAGHLPPERELCKLVNASRPIVRRAIHVLRDEGIVRVVQGRAAEIVEGPSLRKQMASGKRGILLYAEEASFTSQWPLMVLDEVRREFDAGSIHFELVLEPALSRKRVGPRLEKLVDRHAADYWILAGASAAAQEWFHSQALNVVCMGNSFPEAQLPFVNDDLRGVTRHAAGVFLGLGHRQIVFLMREKGSAGESQEEAGFRDAFHSRSGATGAVLKHSGAVDGIRERLAKVFSKKPAATALLVSHAEDMLVVINWCLEKEIRVPEDVSLISFQWAGFLERMRPQPAWYYSDPREHARKLCRLLLRSPGDSRLPRLILPKFVKNGAVARIGLE